MHVGRTNQKLYFVDLSLKQAKQCVDLQSAQCFIESAIFHLKGTVTAFLQEIKVYYSLAGNMTSIDILDKTIREKGQVSFEVLRLKHQYEHGGFLAELEYAYQSVCLAPQNSVKKQSISEIKLINKDDFMLPDHVILESWRLGLKQLIDECRVQMGES